MKTRFGPDGLHCFDRRNGLNVLFDECSFPAEHWSVAPRQVSIALTNVCDLSCPYCYAPKSRHTLDAQRVKGWMKELDQLGSFGVGFGGGEPMLHPAFLDLCRLGSEQTQLAVTCTTHGHRLTEALAKDLRGHVHFMRLSMDGTGKTYEHLRKRPFEVFLKKLELAETVCPVGINFVVNAETFPDLPEAATLAEQLGVRELLLLPERAVGMRSGIDGATLQHLRSWVAGYAGKLNLTVSEADAEGFGVCQPLPHEQPWMAFAHINARGELLSCSYDTHGTELGDLPLSDALKTFVPLEANA